MEWTPGGTSGDIEDRRNDSGGPGFGGYGPHLGIGGFVLLLLGSLVFHRNLFTIFFGGSEGTRPETTSEPARTRVADGNDKQVQFVSFVLDDVQHTWETLLPAQTRTPYRHAKLVLFRDEIQSGCGDAQSATGPFYCPEDEKVYLDLSFFDELRTRFKAPGEFAEAYVIAHEVGYHVQNLLGIMDRIHSQQTRDKGEANRLSVRLELHADFLAGVWAYHAQKMKNI